MKHTLFKQPSINHSNQLIHKPNYLQAYTATVAMYTCMYMHKVIHATLPDIRISPIIAYVKIHTSCMQKHNWTTKLCHSFHEIRFIIKTHIMVRNMIYSLLLLYNCAYTLPITDIRINAEDDDNYCLCSTLAQACPTEGMLTCSWP